MLNSSTVLGSETAASSEPITFLEEFENPGDEYKPYIRWWFSPGSMTKEETRKQVRQVAEDGFGGLEMVALNASAHIGSDEWNECMKWILEEAQDCGLKLAFTIGEGWPVKTPEITDADDIRAQQGLFYKSVDFTAQEDANIYTTDTLPFPDEQFESDRPYELVAVTAAQKKADGTYDASSAVDITSSVSGLNEKKNDISGASVSWKAPENGQWSIFYLYRQSLEAADDTAPVIDHFSADATDAVLDYWENTIMGDPYLKELYESNGSEMFCDSLELGDTEKSKAALWTQNLLSEFEKRRGYDLTPYLPVIFIENIYHNQARAGAHENGGMSEDWPSDFDFGEEGYRIRMDFFQTLTELFTENHVKKIADWSHNHNMSLRYQVYGSVMDVTQSGLAVDIHETETLSSTDIMDFYRTQSGTVHMTGSGVYSTETAAVPLLGWAQTWTGSYHADGGFDDENYWRTDGGNYAYPTSNLFGGSEDAGLLYHYNRQMATGVNRIVMHGFSYDGSGMDVMYSNPWGNVSPLWENIQAMTDYMTRSQYVMQTGQADVDLAVYHMRYYEWCCTLSTPTESYALTEMEKAGYTYDYVSPALLNLDNAMVSDDNGKITLAKDGPTYKALVLDQRIQGTEEPALIANDMPVDTAEKILTYGQAGLPIIIVGEAPNRVNTFGGSSEEMAAEDQRLSEIMNEIMALETTIFVDTQAEIPDALAQLGVYPDTQKDEPSPIVTFHRTDSFNDYYYFYNTDLNHASANTFTLDGNGKPYLLNPWTGEVSPIAEYAADNGSVTVQLSLEPNETAFVVLTGENPTDASGLPHVTDTDAWNVAYTEDNQLAIQAVQEGSYTVTLDNGQEETISFESIPDTFELTKWTMELEDWLPSDNGNLREFNKVQRGLYTLENLTPWNEIEGLEDAGGVATYTASFTLEQGWEDGIGAVIDFGYASDTITVSVNDVSIGNINQLSKKADIGPYLTAGENTITVQVASSLANSKTELTQELGLVGPVVITPYAQKTLKLS